jgi:LacI family transcriptional regulator
MKKIGTEITIRDLARMANTSIASVSRVLSNKPGVNTRKRQQILELVEEYGYQPNRNAQSLILQKTNLIGFIASDLSNPWYIQYLQVINDYCRQRGYQTLVAGSSEDLDREKENINIMLQHRAAGLIIFPVSDWDSGLDCEHLEQLKRNRMPFILMGKPAGHDFSWICSEEEESSYRMTRRLIELGHRRIGLVGYEAVNRPSLERFRGALRAMCEAGLVGEGESLDEPRDLLITEMTLDDSTLNVRDWLNSENPPTALVVVNSDIALSLYRPIMSLGLSIPGDVSLVSFDDHSWCRRIVPSLSVCAADERQIAEDSLDMLMELIENTDSPPQGCPAPRILIERESSGPAPVARR